MKFSKDNLGKEKGESKVSFGIWCLLFLAVIVYSFVSVLAKAASYYPIKTPYALILYGGAVVLMGVYAILWQIVLRYLPLNRAYTVKALAVILTVLWGILFFGEQLRFNMLLGAAFICGGILLGINDDN